MDCPVSTYSFIERLTECGLYGFSLTQVLLLVALAVVGRGLRRLGASETGPRGTRRKI